MIKLQILKLTILSICVQILELIKINLNGCQFFKEMLISVISKSQKNVDYSCLIVKLQRWNFEVENFECLSSNTRINLPQKSLVMNG